VVTAFVVALCAVTIPSSFATAQLVATADLAITMTGAPDPAFTRAEIVYNITVTNNGPDAATGVVLTDTLPAGVTLSPVPIPNCSSAGGIVTCTLGTLASGASTTMRIVVTPNVAGNVTNTACVSAGEHDPDQSNNCATVNTGVLISYFLSTFVETGGSITVSPPSNARPPLCLALAGFHCYGYLAGTSVTLTAVPVSGVVFQGWTGACAGQPNPCVVLMDADKTVTATFEGTPTISDLAITMMRTPNPVYVGTGLTYTLTVTNAGPDVATAVTVTDLLPTGVVFGSMTPTQGSCTAPSGNVVTCNVGPLANGASATMVLTLTVLTTGQIMNYASVSGYESDLNSVNNTAFDILSVGVPARLGNISTRAPVGTGVNVAVGGFIISGTGTKQVLIRGFGPTLEDFGITGAMANPRLELFWDDDSNPSTPAILLLDNDDWGTALGSCPAPIAACGTPTDIVNTGLSADSYAPANANRALDAGLLMTLPPGTYTARLSGVSGGTGVGLIGVDDVDTNQTATLVNISTRAFVGTGANVAVGGFIVNGTSSKQVLLRGFGPTLTSFGVTGALANPTLDLYWDDDNNPSTAAILVLTNDDWGTAVTSCPAPVVSCGTPTDIANTGKSSDTYAPTNANRGLDAALLLTLPPGTYTARLSGVSSGTGVGLIGVDEVTPMYTFVWSEVPGGTPVYHGPVVLP
jgi:uncharacterized repeat protein (TIGR01451 family)